MRSMFVLTTLLLSSLSLSRADSPKAPPDEEIINMSGARLVRVFKQFGTPQDVYPVRNGKDGKPEDDAAVLEYDGFSFDIKDKTVRRVTFFRAWTGTVKGVKIGDTREQAK